MAYNFTNRMGYFDILNMTMSALGARLEPEDVERLARTRNYWNFFEGFHWENIPNSDKPQVTENYCRAFVNKFVAFELGSGFNIKMKPEVEDKILPFLNDVWEDNDKLQLCAEFGQMKSVTGDGWLQVMYEPKLIDGLPNPNFNDPYDEYEKGRIRILSVPSNICFPRYDNGYDKSKLLNFTVMYPIVLDLPNGSGTRQALYKQVWTDKEVEISIGNEVVQKQENKYGRIPFFHIRNLPLGGRNFGLSDLEDLIPSNMELNLKKSDVSEIIDYHSAPVTVVFGARIGQLEKGANKVWGGLPKDAKVQNLALEGDLKASVDYINSTKSSMHEVGGVPESALGKTQAISNTSGVAMQIMLMPLIERINMKRAFTSEGLVEVNKFILKIAFEEGMLKKPEGIKNKDLYFNEIIFEDNLPKDRLVEIQQLQLEMKLGLCDREEAMKRLGKKNIHKRITEIDADRKKYPEVYGLQTEEQKEIEMFQVKSKGLDVMQRPIGTNKAGNDSQVNSGVTNSTTKQNDNNS